MSHKELGVLHAGETKEFKFNVPDGFQPGDAVRFEISFKCGRCRRDNLQTFIFRPGIDPLPKMGIRCTCGGLNWKDFALAYIASTFIGFNVGFLIPPWRYSWIITGGCSFVAMMIFMRFLRGRK